MLGMAVSEKWSGDIQCYEGRRLPSAKLKPLERFVLMSSPPLCTHWNSGLEVCRLRHDHGEQVCGP